MCGAKAEQEAPRLIQQCGVIWPLMSLGLYICLCVCICQLQRRVWAWAHERACLAAQTFLCMCAG